MIALQASHVSTDMLELLDQDGHAFKPFSLPAAVRSANISETWSCAKCISSIGSLSSVPASNKLVSMALSEGLGSISLN